MTVQPDHIRFHHPYEAEERPYRLHSEYTEDTVPNDPVTDMAQAMHIVLKHVTEFITADTEDPFVRYCCLIADLGYKVPEEGFWALVDDYRDTMTVEYSDYYNETLRDFLGPYTEKVAPKVLQYGEPEPDRDTRWRDSRGDLWWWASGWTSGTCHYYWSQLEPSDFPMTKEAK